MKKPSAKDLRRFSFRSTPCSIFGFSSQNRDLTSLRSFSSFWHGIARKRSLLVLRASVAIKSTEKAATMSRVFCTFFPQKVPKTPRRMPLPATNRLTLAPGDYSRGRTRPVPFARAFSRAFVSRLRHRAGIVRGNSVFSAGKRSEHANMRTGANISCSLVRGESRHRPWKRF
mgnify:CR=1 FL=1